MLCTLLFRTSIDSQQVNYLLRVYETSVSSKIAGLMHSLNVSDFSRFVNKQVSNVRMFASVKLQQRHVNTMVTCVVTCVVYGYHILQRLTQKAFHIQMVVQTQTSTHLDSLWVFPTWSH